MLKEKDEGKGCAIKKQPRTMRARTMGKGRQKGGKGGGEKKWNWKMGGEGEKEGKGW